METDKRVQPDTGIVRIADTYLALKGEGEEWCVRNNTIVGKFWDGKLITELPRGNTEETI